MSMITAGIMLSLFLASMESTVVSTAMPTIVGKPGGLSIYSLAFAAYMMTSTTATPIYGKLSDVCGRKRVYVTATAIFLDGSQRRPLAVVPEPPEPAADAGSRCPLPG